MHVSRSLAPRKALMASATALSLAGSVFAAPAQTVEDMEAEIVSLRDSSNAIIAAADEAGRHMTDDELEQINGNATDIERLERQVQARKAVAGAGSTGAARRTDPGSQTRASLPGMRPQVQPQARRADPTGGFFSFGEFAQVVRAQQVSGKHDNRLMAAATTYGNEGTGADGGFTVPPEFRTAIWTKALAEENLLTRCAELQTGGNSITIPKDETTPWQTSGGVQVYWESEGGTATQSKPSFQSETIRLAKLLALVPMTDELLEDAPGLDSWLRAKAPAKMAAAINTAIISGNGVGKPLGILRAPCLVTVTKETSQPADTVRFANIQKMWASVYAPCRRNGIWLINQDIEPQLNGMAFDPAATSKVPVYLPTNGLSDSPYATLMGRPVVPIEACPTLGDKGDLIFADMSQYWALTKTGGGIKTDVSMHLYFDQGLQAYRFTFRVNGQPGWGSSITPQNGTTARSCFVCLEDRT